VHQLQPSCLLSPRRGCPFACQGWAMTRVGRCLPVREPQTVIADASCRAGFAPRPFGRSAPPEPRTLSTWQHTHAAVSQARSTFHRRVPVRSALSLALRAKRRGRHWYLGLATSVQLPTRFRAQPLYARSTTQTGCSPGAQATCRPSISATDRSHEHDCELSRPRCFGATSPSRSG
jgi:hypothetical protein